MRKRSFALAVLSAAAVLAAPAAASAAPGTATAAGTGTAARTGSGTPAAGISSDSAATSATGTKIFSFRGMNLRIPSTWKVRRYGDTALVTTGACTDPEYFYAACRGFRVIGPKSLAEWGYTGKNSYVPTLSQPSCPFGGPGLAVLGNKAASREVRQVGRGHQARYAAWPGYCEAQGSSGRKVTFTQREWFLPTSKILVVDLRDHRELSGLLARATWS
ncbi:hypothetical protein [Streptosporangium sp. NPDC051022]|uniref:hypothetical protein n=1 Tax=Streptosporangium sp. NPDC051022 TaxID=3155752 RepID=UPI003415C6CD